MKAHEFVKLLQVSVSKKDFAKFSSLVNLYKKHGITFDINSNNFSFKHKNRFFYTTRTLIELACYYGDLDIIKCILTNFKKVDLNNSGYGVKHNPLYVACRQGHFEVVKFLWTCSGINVKKNYGKHILYGACRSGKYDLYKYVIEKVKYNPDLSYHNKHSLLYGCTKGKNLKIFTEIFKKNNENFLNHKTSTTIKKCFYGSIENSCHEMFEMIFPLVLKNNSLSSTSHPDRFAPFAALFLGDFSMYKRLMKHGGLKLIQMNLYTRLYAACRGGCYELFKEIEKPFSDVEVDYNEGNEHYTPLYGAIEGNNEKIIMELLNKKGIDINNGSLTPLFATIECGNKKIFNVLLNTKKININKGTFSPLYASIIHGNMEFFKTLLSRNDIDVNAGKNTPLFAACHYGRIDMVKILLSRKEIDINKGEKPPFLTCINLGYFDIFKLLINRNDLDVNKMDKSTKYEYSPLYLCASRGYGQMLQMILEKENVKVNIGLSPLSKACYCGHISIVKRLLSTNDIDINYGLRNPAINGAINGGNMEVFKLLMKCENINLNKGENSPLSLAIRSDSWDIFCELLKNETVNVNYVLEKFWSALYTACIKSHGLKYAKELLKHPSIDPNLTNGSFSPLSAAIDVGNVDIVKEFLKRNDVDVNKGSYHPLRTAARHGNITIAKLLMNYQKKVIVNKKDGAGHTALYWACRYGHEAMVKYLLSIKDINVNSYRKYSSKYRIGPLHGAVESRNLKIVQMMCERSDLKVQLECLSEAAYISNLDIFKVILQRKDVIDTINEPFFRSGRKRSIVGFVSFCGGVSFLKELLKVKKVDVNYGGALHSACEMGMIESVRELLKRKELKVNHFVQESSGMQFIVENNSPLGKACLNGRLEIIKMLLKRKDIDVNAGTTPPLSLCASGGKWDCFKLILKHKEKEINFNKLNVAKRSILAEFGFTYSNEALEVFKILLARQDVDVNIGRISPLYMASQNGFVQYTKELLKHPKINVNKVMMGSTALSYACERGRLKVVQALLSHKNIDVNIGNCLIQTSRCGYKEIFMQLMKCKDIKVNKVDNGNQTALYALCDHFKKSKGVFNAQYGMKERLEMISTLINTKKVDFLSGENSLKLAVENKFFEVVKLLLSHIPMEEKYEMIIKEAFLTSCSKGYTYIMKLLLQRSFPFKINRDIKFEVNDEVRKILNVFVENAQKFIYEIGKNKERDYSIGNKVWKRYYKCAFIIGIGTYTHKSLRNIKYANNNAKEIHKFFKENMHFDHTNLLLDCEYEDFQDYSDLFVSEIQDNMKKEENKYKSLLVVVYFSGYSKLQNGDINFLASDFEISKKKEWDNFYQFANMRNALDTFCNINVTCILLNEFQGCNFDHHETKNNQQKVTTKTLDVLESQNTRGIEGIVMNEIENTICDYIFCFSNPPTSNEFIKIDFKYKISPFTLSFINHASKRNDFEKILINMKNETTIKSNGKYNPCWDSCTSSQLHWNFETNIIEKVDVNTLKNLFLKNVELLIVKERLKKMKQRESNVNTSLKEKSMSNNLKKTKKMNKSSDFIMFKHKMCFNANEVYHISKGMKNDEVAVVQFGNKIPSFFTQIESQKFLYVEFSVEKLFYRCEEGIIPSKLCFGFAKYGYNKMVGFEDDSYSICICGRIFDSFINYKANSCISQDDVVGIGLNMQNGNIFFTINGLLVITSIRNIPVNMIELYYPTITIQMDENTQSPILKLRNSKEEEFTFKKFNLIRTNEIKKINGSYIKFICGFNLEMDSMKNVFAKPFFFDEGIYFTRRFSPQEWTNSAFPIIQFDVKDFLYKETKVMYFEVFISSHSSCTQIQLSQVGLLPLKAYETPHNDSYDNGGIVYVGNGMIIDKKKSNVSSCSRESRENKFNQFTNMKNLSIGCLWDLRNGKILFTHNGKRHWKEFYRNVNTFFLGDILFPTIKYIFPSCFYCRYTFKLAKKNEFKFNIEKYLLQKNENKFKVHPKELKIPSNILHLRGRIGTINAFDRISIYCLKKRLFHLIECGNNNEFQRLYRNLNTNECKDVLSFDIKTLKYTQTSLQSDLNFSLLEYACFKGKIKMVKFLLKNLDDFDMQIGSMSPLSCACYNGHDDIVMLLLKRRSINICSGLFYKLDNIMFACQKGKFNIVRELLKYIPSKFNENLIEVFKYAHKKSQVEICKLLLNRNLHLTQKDYIPKLDRFFSLLPYENAFEITHMKNECIKIKKILPNKWTNCLIIFPMKSNIQIIEIHIESLSSHNSCFIGICESNKNIHYNNKNNMETLKSIQDLNYTHVGKTFIFTIDHEHNYISVRMNNFDVEKFHKKPSHFINGICLCVMLYDKESSIIIKKVTLKGDIYFHEKRYISITKMCERYMRNKSRFRRKELVHVNGKYNIGCVVREFIKVAFLCGMSDYEDLSNLLKPINDVNAISKMFKNDLKFHEVHVVKNVGFEILLRNINEFIESVSKLLNREENHYKCLQCVIFFGCHGITFENISYLLPIDFQRKSFKSKSKMDKFALSTKLLEEKLLKINANVIFTLNQLNILILDACRSNIDESKMESLKNESRNVKRMKGGDFIYVYSTDPSAVAMDSIVANKGALSEKERKHSPFALSCLENMNKSSEFENIMMKIKKRTLQYTKRNQKCWWNSNISFPFMWNSENEELKYLVERKSKKLYFTSGLSEGAKILCNIIVVGFGIWKLKRKKLNLASDKKGKL